MHNFFIIIGSLMLMIGWPTIFFIIASNIMKKKKIKKHIINFFTITILGFILICIGGYMYGQTDEYKESLEKEKQDKNDSTETETSYLESETEQSTEKVSGTEQETETNELDIIETERVYTEDEYKGLCEELYNDDFFESTPDVGKYVKVHVMASSKYKYSSSDMQGIIVKDITKKYNLSMNCLGCTVMHESTKDSTMPSYFGKQIYIMFVDGGEINLKTFKTGQKIVIYGEIIQNTNGTFILPKYYEVEK